MSKKASPSGSHALTTVRAGALDAQLDRAVPSESPTAFLMATKGEMVGRVFPLKHNTIVVGRGAECDIQLTDASVSTRHTRLLSRPHGFDVEDLGSTNGTFVDDHAVTRGTLTSGQRLRLGAVEFKLLLDQRSQPTMLLVPTLVQPTTTSGGAVPPRRRLEQDVEADEGVSLQEMLGKGIRIYRVVRKHFMAAGIILGLSLLAAAISVIWLPPGSSAMCEVKLHPEERTNPVDPTTSTAPKNKSLFESPERAFINPTLIETTLKTLGKPAYVEEVNAVQARLKLEPVSENGYIASFSEGMLTRGRYDLVALLTTHVKTYVQNETDKALSVSVAETEFLRAQTAQAEKELSKIDAELRTFKEENLSSLPESATLALGSRAQMEARKPELVAQLTRLKGEIASVKSQIASEGPLSQGHTQSSTAHRTRLAAINEKLAELRARSLTDEHPEVRALAEEKKLTEGLINQELSAGQNDLERKTSPELHALEVRLQSLESQEAASRTELSELSDRIHVAKKLLTEMPRVDARLQELLLKQEDQRKLYSQMFEQLKRAEVRLQLERVSVSSRHEITSPPRLWKARKSKVALQRFGLAAGLAFVVIGIMILAKELRPMVQAAWNAAEANERGATRS